MLNKKYNRSIMSKILIYDPEPYSLMSEDNNIGKMSKVKEIIYNIIEALISFFKQAWRAMTSVINRLKKLRKTLDDLDKVKFELSDDYLTASTTGGKHFKNPQLSYLNNTRLFKANMKLIREIVDGCNNILDQRLNDLNDNKKIDRIQNNSIIETLDKKRETLDQIIEDTDQHEKFYMYKFNYDDRGISLHGKIYSEDSPNSTRVTSDAMFRKLVSGMKNGIDALIKHASKTEEYLDKASSNRRKLMMTLNKNNTNGEASEIINELKTVLKSNLDSSRKGFGLMMKMSGQVIKDYSEFVNWCKKNLSND